MFNHLKSSIINHVINFPGWRTNRKIIVIESDDWGMIRMASRESYRWFLKKGYHVDQCPYNRNDSIEGNDDLELLFEVLSSVKDRNGNSALFTANNIVANPDFEKIRDSGFQVYYFEPFTETLKKYPGRDRVFELYKQGISQKVFYPQFHGREHINVNRWMDGLNSGIKLLHDAFKQNMFTVHKKGKISGRRDNLDAFGLKYEKEWVGVKEIIQTGINLFEGLWGYRSLSFIAPCYIWPVEIESILAKNGVKYIQGTHVQRMPCIDDEDKIIKMYHYLGQKNRLKQSYLVRNVYFEPTENGRDGSVEKAMKQIKIAFRYKKPAIVSSHRVNYAGSINPENRDINLKLLGDLLQRIVKQYPDVEFMSSDQLGKLMTR